MDAGVGRSTRGVYGGFELPDFFLKNTPQACSNFFKGQNHSRIVVGHKLENSLDVK